MPANIPRIGRFITLVVVLAASMRAVAVPVITPAFQDHYSITADLGQYPLYPFGGNYSALCFSPTDPNELLVGAQVTTLARGIVRTTVARDASGHITGFSGITGNFAYASPNIDSGLAYGPDGVLFATTHPDNLLYQYKPGSFEVDKTIDLSALGVYPSTGTVAFVPPGYPGAGGVRFIQVWPFGQMYSADLAPDGNGTFNVSNVTPVMNFGGDNIPQQMLWVPPNSPGFDNANKHVLVANYGSQRVAAYQLDTNSNPIFGTQLPFITGLVGSQGAVVDPLTGDFLFSTNGEAGGGDHIYVVSRTAPSGSTFVIHTPVQVRASSSNDDTTYDESNLIDAVITEASIDTSAMNINGSSTSNFGDSWAVANAAGNGVLVLDMGSSLSLDGLLYAQRTFNGNNADDFGHVSIWIQTADPGAATLALPGALGAADAEFNLLVDDNGSTLRRYNFSSSLIGRYAVLLFTNPDAFFPGGQELRLFTDSDQFGDFNHDGRVDAADYVVWRKNPGRFPADAYATWRSLFGQTAGSGSSTNASVPEPSSALLLILGAAIGSCTRRRTVARASLTH